MLIAKIGHDGGVYIRRTPEKSDLYRIACQHFKKYDKNYLVRHEGENGYFIKISAPRPDIITSTQTMDDFYCHEGRQIRSTRIGG